MTLLFIGKHPFPRGAAVWCCGPRVPMGLPIRRAGAGRQHDVHDPTGGERNRAVSMKTSERSREEPGNGFRWTVRSFEEWPDLDLAEEDFGAFGLDDDLALGETRLRRGVDDIAVHDVRDRATVADDFHAVPFAGGFFDVAGAAETEDVLPGGVAAPPVEPCRVAGLLLAAFFVVQLAVGTGAGFAGQAGLVAIWPTMMKSPQPPSMIWHSCDSIQ